MKSIRNKMAVIAASIAGVGFGHAATTPISSLAGIDSGPAGAGPFRVTGNVTLATGTDYELDQNIYVDGGTLTIQPGVIIASTDRTLIVCRGSQIFAEGTAQSPIIFTSMDDYNNRTDPTNFPNAPQIGDNGQWGGVIILGNAPINFYVAGNPFTGETTGNTNLGENKIEGIPSGADLDFDGFGDLIEYGQDNGKASAATPTLTAGTTNAADNSGVFKYVSIRFGGQAIAQDDEVNGLTMGGVGSGTVIEHVEVFNNSDDGFEWFGGTVNCKNLVAAFNEDEAFDMDEGYQGTIQFAFAIREDFPDGSNNVENVSELDGGNGSIKTGTPLTTAKVYNATLLGAGRTGAVSAAGTLFRMKDNYAGQWHNSVFDDFGGNLVRIDDTNTAARVGNELKVNNSTWGRFNGVATEGQTAAAAALIAQTGNTAVNTDPQLRGVSRSDNAGLDPRPLANSPLLSGTLSPVPAGFETVGYRGAFGTENWAASWTYLGEAGFFGDISSGVDPIPAFVDTDGDGISDFLETKLAANGFDPNIAQPFLASQLLGNSQLFTPSSIQNLSADDIVVQKSGSTVNLAIPVESSVNLVPPFTPVGNATLTIPNVPADKEFYRFRIPGAP